MSEVIAKARTAALKLAPTLRIDPEIVNDGYGIVLSVFGEDWLKGVCQPQRMSPLPFARHPIGSCLVTPRENQVIKLLELAEYLTFAAEDPNFDTLVEGLKEDFASTRLQLAFGHRFARAGANDVRFEPPAAGGRIGDISFRVADNLFMTECTITRREQKGESAKELTRICQEAVNLFKGEFPVTSVAIQLEEPPSADLRKAIVSELRKMRSELYGGGYVPPGASVYSTVRGTKVSVGRSEKAPAGEQSRLAVHPDFLIPDAQPAQFIRVGLAPRSVLKEVNPNLTFPTGSHVAVWFSEELQYERSLERDLEEPIARLTKKLKRKLKQTRREGATGRVLVAQTWIYGQLGRADEEHIAGLHRRLFKQHEDVACVLIVGRPWDRASKRFRYEIQPLLAEETDLLPAPFVEQLVRLEHEHAIPAIVDSSRLPE